LDCADGKKIRLKVLLAINQVSEDLYSTVREIGAGLPLEMVPYLIELVQQEIGVAGVGQGKIAHGHHATPRDEADLALIVRRRR